MFHNHCVACGIAHNLHQHHLVPKSLGGVDDEHNCITLCGSCHAKVHSIKSEWNNSSLTKKAMDAKKERGECIGSIPYGYQLDNDGIHVVPNLPEIGVISKAKELRAQGMSLRKVASELYLQGFNARNGRKLQAAQVVRMLAVTVDSAL